ncbi:calcium homeostasis modulator protein 6-like [Poecile atricapillus]|uniref:calcium homeostasis modulator protein 6-like n=1 Tax=Poecile atricapillus TaxID=48891 RepID=UPI00273A2F12|nr:calcium homeostasis modulator protein 6-like [Poecile atricapillus]
MDMLHKVVDFCIQHQTILGYSTVSLLTAASEYLFSSVVFKCPCNSWNMVYGSSFLFAPAFVLLLLGCMVNAKIWRLLTGKCSPEKQCISCGTCARYCQLLVPMAAKTLVAPLTWIVVALLGANFYECAASGSRRIQRFFCKDNVTDFSCRKNLSRIPCDEELSAKLSSEWLSLQAQSQVIGWFLIAIIMTVALISTCASRCCSPVSYLQFMFWKSYTEKEDELFEMKTKEHATKLAERNTNCFFEATDPAPFHTPSNEDWQKISLVYTFNSDEQYYSRIHKYVDTNRVNSTKLREDESHQFSISG